MSGVWNESVNHVDNKDDINVQKLSELAALAGEATNITLKPSSAICCRNNMKQEAINGCSSVILV